MNKDVLENYRLLNESEASQLLSIAKKTLQNWRQKRIGPIYIKVQSPEGMGSVRYSLRDLHNWITESKVSNELY